MTEIPFPKITLVPINQRDKKILNYLSNRVCDYSIKEILSQSIDSYYEAHRPAFPSEPKEFYLVPYLYVSIFKDYGLDFPQYAALYLPDVANKVLEIRNNAPEDLKESAIIAWDYNFSHFTGQDFVLAVDLSWGEAQFVFWTNAYFKFPPDYQFLAELVKK